MFTGLVEHLAKVRAVESRPPGKRLVIEGAHLAQAAAIGESIAVNGCCLTVVEREEGCLSFDAGPETLDRTTLGQLAAGDQVNLEASLRVGDRLGGHFVTGHVEGLGTLDSRHDERDWSTFWFSFPPELSRYMAAKGSIAVDGVSLTLVDVEPKRFSVALIPHTLRSTTLGKLRVGGQANLETDLLAKYAQRQIIHAD
jgi:riboflavin synthase